MLFSTHRYHSRIQMENNTYLIKVSPAIAGHFYFSSQAPSERNNRIISTEQFLIEKYVLYMWMWMWMWVCVFVYFCAMHACATHWLSHMKFSTSVCGLSWRQAHTQTHAWLRIFVQPGSRGGKMEGPRIAARWEVMRAKGCQANRVRFSITKRSNGNWLWCAFPVNFSDYL